MNIIFTQYNLFSSKRSSQNTLWMVKMKIVINICVVSLFACCFCVCSNSKNLSTELLRINSIGNEGIFETSDIYTSVVITRGGSEGI